MNLQSTRNAQVRWQALSRKAEEDNIPLSRLAGDKQSDKAHKVNDSDSLPLWTRPKLQTSKLVIFLNHKR